jgi:hypothetical protein
VTDRNGQPAQQPTPHTARNCHLCGSLRHPGLTAQGRALRAHLTQHPLPQQGTGEAGR